MKRLLSILITSVFLVSASSSSKYQHGQRALYFCGPVSTIAEDSLSNIPGKVYFDFHTELDETQISKRHRGVKATYFTSYLINTSDTAFTITKQDGSLMMIQEALDNEGNWRPIEYWVPSSCGNSYYQLRLQPNEYVTVPIRQYEGDFATKVRLRMYRNSSVFVSKPFETTIDKGLFNKIDTRLNGVLYQGRPWYFED